MSGEFNTATIIAIIAVVVILFLAIRYIVREKKRGVHCIGCPMAGACTKSYKKMEEEMKQCLERNRTEKV